jgi:hypothetical protein
MGDQLEYHVGDQIVWYRDGRGEIVEPFTFIEGKDGRRRWNCGDVDAAEAKVLTSVSGYGVESDAYPCKNCGGLLHALAITITRGIIESICFLDDVATRKLLSDHIEDADILTRSESGDWALRPDLFDVPMVKMISATELE